MSKRRRRRTTRGGYRQSTGQIRPRPSCGNSESRRPPASNRTSATPRERSRHARGSRGWGCPTAVVSSCGRSIHVVARLVTEHERRWQPPVARRLRSRVEVGCCYTGPNRRAREHSRRFVSVVRPPQQSNAGADAAWRLAASPERPRPRSTQAPVGAGLRRLLDRPDAPPHAANTPELFRGAQ
jgi:hypothetical protein